MAEALIERMARAMFDGRPHNLTRKRPGEEPVRIVPDWDIQPASVKDVFRRDARAALAAAREPTVAITMAFHGLVPPCGVTAEDAWTAMIDAELADGQE